MLDMLKSVLLPDSYKNFIFCLGQNGFFGKMVKNRSKMGYKIIIYGLFNICSIFNIVERIVKGLNIKYFNNWGLISMFFGRQNGFF